MSAFLPEYTQVPALSGKQPVGLLKKDGWVEKRQAKHGIALSMSFGNCNSVTIIHPDNPHPL